MQRSGKRTTALEEEDDEVVGVLDESRGKLVGYRRRALEHVFAAAQRRSCRDQSESRFVLRVRKVLGILDQVDRGAEQHRALAFRVHHDPLPIQEKARFSLVELELQMAFDRGGWLDIRIADEAQHRVEYDRMSADDDDRAPRKLTRGRGHICTGSERAERDERGKTATDSR